MENQSLLSQTCAPPMRNESVLGNWAIAANFLRRGASDRFPLTPTAATTPNAGGVWLTWVLMLPLLLHEYAFSYQPPVQYCDRPVPCIIHSPRIRVKNLQPFSVESAIIS
jgi:hypothetical protein